MINNLKVTAFWLQRIAVVLTLIVVTTSYAPAEATSHCANPSDAKIGTELPNEACPRSYVGSDPIIENFGAREAPYEGFLVFPQTILPNGYNEKSHHYTKREYSISFEIIIDNVAYDFDIIESGGTQFFEPDKQNIVKEFNLNGCSGRVFAYREHLTERPALALYWLKCAKTTPIHFGATRPCSPILARRSSQFS